MNPIISPDGNSVALRSDGDIWIYEPRRDAMRRLSREGGIYPLWTPDGRYIVFQATGGMFWTRSDGATKPQQLTHSKDVQYPYSFSPDGKRLAFVDANPGSGYDLWTVPVESDANGLRAGKPDVFLQTPQDERHPAFSPDGNWLAYASDESGTFQIYVRAFPDTGEKHQVSSDGGAYPVWSRSRRELFFRTDDNRVMVASYAIKGKSFESDKPRLWSERRLASVGMQRSFDLGPNGDRIAALLPAATEGEADRRVTFLLNFVDELRRRVPVGGK